MEQELSFFNLDKKWNDYIGAQKKLQLYESYLF